MKNIFTKLSIGIYLLFFVFFLLGFVGKQGFVYAVKKGDSCTVDGQIGTWDSVFESGTRHWVCDTGTTGTIDTWMEKTADWANNLAGVRKPKQFKFENPERLDGGFISSLVSKIISYIFPVAGFIALIFVIYGGYMWMASTGNPEGVKKAQGTLTWSVIGLIMIMVVYALINVILKFLYK